MTTPISYTHTLTNGRQLDNQDAFILMGCTILGSAVLCLGLKIKGHSNVWGGVDAPPKALPATLSVPKADAQGSDGPADPEPEPEPEPEPAEGEAAAAATEDV